MKLKYFCLGLSAAVCSACSAPIPQILAPSLDIYFSAEAELSYGGAECTVQMRRINNNNWEFCVTDPYPLEGLVISVKDGETKLTMFDTQALADISSDAVSAAKLISEAFEAAAGKSGGTEIAASRDSADGVSYSFTGQCPFGSYVIGMNDDMQPVSVDISERGVKVDIKKFALLEKNNDEDAIISE